MKSLQNQENYIFRIMGKGWKPLLDKLLKTGIQVQYTDTFTADLYQQFLCTSDYLLYTGDEDSLAQSVIDAKNAGLRVIAPPREELAIDLPFTCQADLNQIFAAMVKNEVKDWTWANFVLNHTKVWEKLVK